MKTQLVFPGAIALTSLLSAVGLTGPPASAEVRQPTSTQAVVCEYTAPAGTGAYGHSQYTFYESHIRYFPRGSVVWAAPTVVVNTSNHYDFAVRELAGSGGGWASAERLRRTGAKCHELR